MKKNRKSLLPPDECALFCDEVALMLGSGIALCDGMEALYENYADTRYAEAFDRMRQIVRDTGSLHEAIRDAGLFPIYMIGMTEVGERAGRLDAVMSALAAYYRREKSVRDAVRGAVTYPICLTGMMAAVIAVLILRVMPVFRQVYASLGSGLSGSADAAMDIGIRLGGAVLGVVGALVALLLVFLALLGTSLRAPILRAFTRRVRAARRMSDKLAASRVSAVMSMTLESGYPIDQAVSFLTDLYPDGDMKKRLCLCRDAVFSGEPLPDAVAKCGLFDTLHLKMIKVGALAGRADATFARLADICTEELDEEIGRAVSFIEPVLVAVLSVVIGAILLSVMLPLTQILTMLG